MVGDDAAVVSMGAGSKAMAGVLPLLLMEMT
jgi:hypothetical protein